MSLIQYSSVLNIVTKVLGTKRSFPPGYEPTLVFLAPDRDKRARFIECGSEEHVDDVQRVAEEELRLKEKRL